MKTLRWLWWRWRLGGFQSWRVVYPDGKRTYPQTRDSAESLVRLFGGRIEWARDHEGNLT